MKQKFDLEDKKDTTGHKIWELGNEKVKAGQQLRLVEDQLRVVFDRERVRLDEDGGKE